MRGLGPFAAFGSRLSGAIGAAAGCFFVLVAIESIAPATSHLTAAALAAVALTPDELLACAACDESVFHVPCLLSYGAYGTVTSAMTGQPLPGAQVEVGGLPTVFSDELGEYRATGTRTDSCNFDYDLSVQVTAVGFDPTTFSVVAGTASFPFHVDFQLEAAPSPTPTPSCTPDGNPAPGCANEGPPFTVTPTPTPGGPILHVEPASLPPFVCQGAFDLIIRNSGGPGTVLVVDAVSLSHGYSQGDYGTDFQWDLSGVTFPVSLADGQGFTIPIEYHGPVGPGFRSRLHVGIASNAVLLDPPVIGPFFGVPCATPTITCTPGSDLTPRCDGPPTVTQTPTPRPDAAILHVEPAQLPHIACEGGFNLQLVNIGPPGTVLVISNVVFFHGYSQGYYGRDFQWDLSGLSFPVSVESGASIAIPVSYHASSPGPYSFPSRLHVRVDSNAVASDPPVFGPYFGDLCATPTATVTPTPGDSPDLVPSRLSLFAPPPVGGCLPPSGGLTVNDEVCVANHGGAPSGPFAVVIHSSAATVPDEFRMDGLAIGEERCVLRPYTPFDAQVIVDVGAEVDESNEDNNHLDTFVPVLTPPRPCASTTPTSSPVETPSATRTPTDLLPIPSDTPTASPGVGDLTSAQSGSGSGCAAGGQSGVGGTLVVLGVLVGFMVHRRTHGDGQRAVSTRGRSQA